MKQKSSMEKIMRLMFEDNEANVWRSNYVGQTYVGWTNAFIFATFFNTLKTSLNWRLDSTLTDYVLLIFIVTPP